VVQDGACGALLQGFVSASFVILGAPRLDRFAMLRLTDIAALSAAAIARTTLRARTSPAGAA
jgi:hypothetical protein